MTIIDLLNKINGAKNIQIGYVSEPDTYLIDIDGLITVPGHCKNYWDDNGYHHTSKQVTVRSILEDYIEGNLTYKPGSVIVCETPNGGKKFTAEELNNETK